MSPYSRLLDIARRQNALAEAGDLELAIALLNDRESLLVDAPQPTSATDVEAVREVLNLDRDLATAIRRRMIALRDEAVLLRHGRSALVGYRPPVGERRARRLDSVG